MPISIEVVDLLNDASWRRVGKALESRVLGFKNDSKECSRPSPQ